MSFEDLQQDNPSGGGSSRVMLRLTGQAGEVPFSERAGMLYRILHDHDTPLLPDLRVACDDTHIYVDAIAPTTNQLGVLHSTIEEVDTALLSSYLLPPDITVARMSTNVPDLDTPRAWQYMSGIPSTNITPLARAILLEHRDHTITPTNSDYVQVSALDSFTMNF